MPVSSSEPLPTTGLPPADWRANYYWRAFGTFLGFLGFGIAGILASIVAIPLVLWPGSIAQRQQRMRLFTSYLFKAAIEYFRLIGIIRYEVRGNLADLQQPGALIVANHPSLIDTVFMMSFIPRVNCIVSADRLGNPFLGAVIRGSQYILNSEDPEQLLQRCKQALHDGNSLLVFPEGTRNVPGKPMTLKRGAARIALLADAPIVPVAINCDPRTLTKGEKWYKIPKKQIIFTITIGDTESLNVKPPYNNEVNARALTQRMQNYFQQYVEY